MSDFVDRDGNNIEIGDRVKDLISGDYLTVTNINDDLLTAYLTSDYGEGVVAVLPQQFERQFVKRASADWEKTIVGGWLKEYGDAYGVVDIQVDGTYNWSLQSLMFDQIAYGSEASLEVAQAACDEAYQRNGGTWGVLAYTNAWGVEVPELIDIENAIIGSCVRTVEITEDDQAWNPNGLTGDDYDRNDDEQMAFPYLQADYTEKGSYSNYSYEIDCMVHVEEGKGFCDYGYVSVWLNAPTGKFRLDSVEKIIAHWFDNEKGGWEFWAGKGEYHPFEYLLEEVDYQSVIAEEIQMLMSYDSTMQRSAQLYGGPGGWELLDSPYPKIWSKDYGNAFAYIEQKDYEVYSWSVEDNGGKELEFGAGLTLEEAKSYCDAAVKVHLGSKKAGLDEWRYDPVMGVWLKDYSDGCAAEIIEENVDTFRWYLYAPEPNIDLIDSAVAYYIAAAQGGCDFAHSQYAADPNSVYVFGSKKEGKLRDEWHIQDNAPFPDTFTNGDGKFNYFIHAPYVNEGYTDFTVEIRSNSWVEKARKSFPSIEEAKKFCEDFSDGKVAASKTAGYDPAKGLEQSLIDDGFGDLISRDYSNPGSFYVEDSPEVRPYIEQWAQDELGISDVYDSIIGDERFIDQITGKPSWEVWGSKKTAANWVKETWGIDTIFTDAFTLVEVWVGPAEGRFDWGVFAQDGTLIGSGMEDTFDLAQIKGMNCAEEYINGMPLGYTQYGEPFSAPAEEYFLTSKKAQQSWDYPRLLTRWQAFGDSYGTCDELYNYDVFLNNGVWYAEIKNGEDGDVVVLETFTTYEEAVDFCEMFSVNNNDPYGRIAKRGGAKTATRQKNKKTAMVNEDILDAAVAEINNKMNTEHGENFDIFNFKWRYDRSAYSGFDSIVFYDSYENYGIDNFVGVALEFNTQEPVRIFEDALKRATGDNGAYLEAVNSVIFEYVITHIATKKTSAKTATRQFTYAEMQELDEEIEGRELHNRARLKAFEEEGLW